MPDQLEIKDQSKEYPHSRSRGWSLEILNEKWWYRLIKVSCLVVLVPIYILILLLVINKSEEHFYPNDIAEYISETRPTSISLTFGIVDPFESTSGKFSSEKLEKYRVLNAISAPIYNRGAVNRLLEQALIREKYSSWGIYIPNYKKALYYSLITTLLFLLFIEVARRMFYYIVLGSIFPAINEKSKAFRLRFIIAFSSIATLAMLSVSAIIFRDYPYKMNFDTPTLYHPPTYLIILFALLVGTFTFFSVLGISLGYSAFTSWMGSKGKTRG